MKKEVFNFRCPHCGFVSHNYETRAEAVAAKSNHVAWCGQPHEYTKTKPNVQIPEPYDSISVTTL